MKRIIQKGSIPARTQSQDKNFQASQPCEIPRSGQVTAFVVCAVFSLSFQAVVLLTKTATNHPVFDSRIIRRMICESMLSTKMQKLLQCTVALVNQTVLRALCSFFKQTGTPGLAHNMQARPWSLVSILALLHEQGGCVCV